MSARDERANGGKDWSDDPRLTAYALGELEGEELAQLEAELDGDEEALAVVAELRVLGATLEGHFAAEEAPGLSARHRDAIEARLSAPATEPQPHGQGTLLRRSASRKYLAYAASLVAVGFFGWLLSDFFKEEAPVHGLGSVQLANVIYEIEGRSSRTYHGPGDSVPPRGAGSTQYYLGTTDSRFRTPVPGRGTGGVVPAENLEQSRRGGIEEPSREGYDHISENPFQLTLDEPYSTFSIDVDTASYANVRRMIEDGQRPPADAVRIEELVNYFPYAYPAPEGEHPFSVDVEVGSAPWAPAHRLVRVGLQGRETLPAERRSSNLVFLLDVSGSMNSPNKLPLLKQALHMLVQELDERDTVSIVVYAGASGLALEPTNCSASVNIHMALEALAAGGSTNGGAGIELAYKVAAENYVDGGINRVILATDGDFNVGVSDNGSLVRLIEEKARTGVFLSVLGFGTGNLQDSKMEQLADKGNGNYAYIDSLMEARKVLVEEMGSTLETIAKDVKIQVEFNPAEVQAYRLIGYENRMLATRDFNDDRKDAGEIGAGHSVTALYEVVPVGVELDVPGIDPLRYQAPKDLTADAFGGELLLLKLRYKQPESDTSTLLTTPVTDAGLMFHELGAETRWAATVAAFGMILRDSDHRGTATLGDVGRWALESAQDDPGGYRAQFIGLVGKVKGM